jgi:hypothetical protein
MNEASWIAGEQSYGIRSSTIHSLKVDDVLAPLAVFAIRAFACGPLASSIAGMYRLA